MSKPAAVACQWLCSAPVPCLLPEVEDSLLEVEG